MLINLLVNGNHLAADSTFIEKRRRGLVRFTNALIRHPVLGQEQLVTMFLTVPTVSSKPPSTIHPTDHQELAVWRKQANLSVQEEFAGKSLPPGLEDSLSPTLNDLFDATRTGVRRSAEVYIHLCNLMDRLSKRTEGLAADHLRLALSLQTLTDASHDTYATDTNEVPLLNEGLQATAKHVSNCQTLLEDEARAWDQGVLEDLKTQRDGLVSLRDMFERRERYDRDNIPQLEKRIQSNESKLISIRNKPDGMVKPGEVEKVTEAIIKVRIPALLRAPSHSADCHRIRNPSLPNTLAVSLSLNACVTSCSFSSQHNTPSRDCTSTGHKNVSSTRSFKRTTGSNCWISSRPCRSSNAN